MTQSHLQLRRSNGHGDEPETGAPTARDEGWISRRNALGLRQVLQIAVDCDWNQKQLAVLLGTVPRTLQRWRDQAEREGALPLSGDTVERLSYLLGIWKALVILFPTPANRGLWLRQPNAAPPFNGQAPLARMLSGQVADLYVVRQVLDGARG